MKSSDIIVKIRSMDLVQTYHWLITMEDAPEAIRKKARWGWLNPKIDIYDFINGNITTKNKQGLLIVKNQAFDSADVHTDFERREELMKSWLIDYYDDGGIAGARRLRKDKNIVTVREVLDEKQKEI